MRPETRLTLCATLLVLAVLAIAPVRSQESKGKITLTVNPDGSMSIEANLRVPLPPEISIEADGAIDYNPSAGESVIQGTIDVTLAPSILATLPIRNANASFSGTENTAKGTLGLELVPNEQIPVQGISANLDSNTDAAGNTTINADGFFTIAYIPPYGKDIKNMTVLVSGIKVALLSIAENLASSTNNSIQVTKLQIGDPELLDTYAKSTFSATVLVVSSQVTSVSGLLGITVIDPEVLSKITAELQEQNLARIRTWQAEGTYSANASKIEASYNFYLIGDVDTSVNAMIDVYKELAQSGAIKDFDVRLMPLFETRIFVKDSDFKVTTSQGELQIAVTGIVLKPPVERTPAGFRISPDWISAASTQLRETSQGLEFTVQGNGVNIMVSPEAPKPTTATSSKVVWSDFNVNLLSHLEFATAPVITTSASTATTTAPATTSASTTITTSASITTSATTTTTSTTAAGPAGLELPVLPVLIVAVIIVIIVLAAVMLLRRKKQTAQIPPPPPRPVQ